MTKIRASPYHLRRSAIAGSFRIISSNPPGIAMKRRRKPVRTPLPNIARHVVETKIVRRIASNWRGPMPAILKCVRVRKLALPDVAHVLTIGFQLVAPCEPRLIQPATGRVFPLRLRRHSSPDPIAIRHRIGPRDMRHRVISAIIDTRTRPLRHPPIRAVDSPPPLRTLHHLRNMSLDLNGVTKSLNTNDQSNRSASVPYPVAESQKHRTQHS